MYGEIICITTSKNRMIKKEGFIVDPASALAQEDILPHLVLQVTVKEQDKDAEWAKAIVDAYHSDEFKAYLEENNTGMWWIPEELR